MTLGVMAGAFPRGEPGRFDHHGQRHGHSGMPAYGAIRVRGRGLATIAQVHAPLAQLAEQQTLNLRVRGSSPWRRTDVMSQDIEDTLNPYRVRGVFGWGPGGRPRGW